MFVARNVSSYMPFLRAFVQNESDITKRKIKDRYIRTVYSFSQNERQDYKMAVCELGTFFRARCQTTASRCAGDFRCHSANQGHCKRYRCAFSKSLSYETLEDMTDKRKRHSMHKI